jgi:hypothetical protein
MNNDKVELRITGLFTLRRRKVGTFFASQSPTD